MTAADERPVTVCFTGHRRLPDGAGDVIKNRVAETVRELYAAGMRIFLAGGALGFDMLASETVLGLGNELGGIRLRLILPFSGYCDRWDPESRRRLNALIENAERVDTLSDRYYGGCYQVRNKALVDRSSVCVAYLTSSSGGTAWTVSYAARRAEEIINIAGGEVIRPARQISLM